MKQEKFMLCISLLLVTMTVLSVTVSAFHPNTHDFYVQCEEGNLPDGTYVDILLPIPEDDKNFVPVNRDTLDAYSLPEDCQIVTYCEDGYRSFLFHFRYAVRQTDIKADYQPQNGYCGIHFPISEETDTLSVAKQYKTAKVAYFDSSGTVLSVTNEASLMNLKSELRYLIEGSPDYLFFISGDNLRVDINFGPPLVYVVPVPVVLILLFVIVKLNRFYRKKHKTTKKLLTKH